MQNLSNERERYNRSQHLRTMSNTSPWIETKESLIQRDTSEGQLMTFNEVSKRSFRDKKIQTCISSAELLTENYLSQSPRIYLGNFQFSTYNFRFYI